MSPMSIVGVGDLATGAGLLRVDADGRALDPIVVVDLDGADWSQAASAVAALRDRRTTVLVGVASAPLPEVAAPLLELLTCTLAPGGPGRTWVAPADDDLDRIRATVAGAPYAAVTLAGLLAMTARASVTDGLAMESLAYSMLLSGPEFAAWRVGVPRKDVALHADPVLLDRDGDTLELTLNRPERHNAFGHGLRDGLLAGLEIAELDDSIREVVVRGNGRSFCSGGDLDEFGTTPDVAAAHLVRLQQSAGHAVRRLGSRVRFVVHGACIGAGVEIPSFAARVEARADAYFRLPELSMGLVPGAGGTVSITHRIGPWRTAYLALVDRPVDVGTALAWGLVDARA